MDFILFALMGGSYIFYFFKHVCLYRLVYVSVVYFTKERSIIFITVNAPPSPNSYKRLYLSSSLPLYVRSIVKYHYSDH